MGRVSQMCAKERPEQVGLDVADLRPLCALFEHLVQPALGHWPPQAKPQLGSVSTCDGSSGTAGGFMFSIGCAAISCSTAAHLGHLKKLCSACSGCSRRRASTSPAGR
jgi:hypothetical protein